MTAFGGGMFFLQRMSLYNPLAEFCEDDNDRYDDILDVVNHYHGYSRYARSGLPISTKTVREEYL